MAEPALGRALFWQAWAVAALIATLVPTVRLARPHHTVSLKSEHVAAQTSAPVRHVIAEEYAATPTPGDDAVPERLALAETASERCELLGQVKATVDPRATYAISDVLDHSGLGSVRACAAQALALQPNQEAQSWLIELSDDPLAAVRDSALSALATRDDSAARTVVVEATHAEDVEIRSSAVVALLKAGREEGFSAALALLPSIDDRATLAALIDALGESHDPRALQPLGALIDGADSESRLLAIGALGELGVASAAARLERLLDVGTTREFQAAAGALVQLAPEQALSKLRLALSSGDEERSLLALGAMINLASPEVLPLLKDQLGSGDEVRARVVLHYLARKPVPELEAQLAQFAANDDLTLKRPALRALERLGTPSARATAERLAKQNAGPVPRSLVALARDPSCAAQTELLQGVADPTRRANTLNIVAELAPAATVQQIIQQASTLGVDAQRDLIQGLAQRGDPRFSEALREALRDRDQGTRNAALRGLLGLGDEAALAEAQRMARASEPEERAVALDLLAIRSESNVAELEALAKDSDVGLVSRALHVIQGRAPDRILELATRAFRGASPEDRVNLLSNLSDLKGNVVKPLYELALREGDDDAAIEAVHSLSALEGPDSARQLLDVANDSNRSAEVRAEAASGLRALGGPLARSNRALLDSLSEPSATEEFVCASL
ncbi:MAG: HEAT repeat domain-containing protein [Myxococcales bacterium]